MKQNCNTKEKPKTFRWYLDKIFMVAVAALVITGVVIWTVSAEEDDMTMMYVGTAMLPGCSVLITPNIVLYALNDNKSWKSKFTETQNDLHKNSMLCPAGDMSQYQNKLVWGVRREALWNLFKLILAGVAILAVSVAVILSGDSVNDGTSFFVIIAVLTLGIPILAYNITSSLYRIRTVKRREYVAYRAAANAADKRSVCFINQKDKIHIFECSFEYFRCLGVRPKEIHDTNVILVFVPDEVYLVPENGQE